MPGSLAAGCVTARDSEGVPRRAPGPAQEEAGATAAAAAAVQQVPSPEPSATRRAKMPELPKNHRCPSLCVASGRRLASARARERGRLECPSSSWLKSSTSKTKTQKTKTTDQNPKPKAKHNSTNVRPWRHASCDIEASCYHSFHEAKVLSKIGPASVRAARR